MECPGLYRNHIGCSEPVGCWLDFYFKYSQATEIPSSPQRHAGSASTATLNFPLPARCWYAQSRPRRLVQSNNSPPPKLDLPSGQQFWATASLASIFLLFLFFCWFSFGHPVAHPRSSPASIKLSLWFSAYSTNNAVFFWATTAWSFLLLIYIWFNVRGNVTPSEEWFLHPIASQSPYRPLRADPSVSGPRCSRSSTASDCSPSALRLVSSILLVTRYNYKISTYNPSLALHGRDGPAVA